jgi:hypothetical protein
MSEKSFADQHVGLLGRRIDLLRDPEFVTAAMAGLLASRRVFKHSTTEEIAAELKDLACDFLTLEGKTAEAVAKIVASDEEEIGALRHR